MLSQEIISSMSFGFIFLAIFFTLQVIITTIDEDYDSMTLRYIVSAIVSMYFFNDVFVASMLWFKLGFVFLSLAVLGNVFLNGLFAYAKK